MFLNVGKTGVCMINTESGKGVLGESCACLISFNVKTSYCSLENWDLQRSRNTGMGKGFH